MRGAITGRYIMGDAITEVMLSTTRIRKAPNAIVITSATAFFTVISVNVVKTCKAYKLFGNLCTLYVEVCIICLTKFYTSNLFFT